MKLHRRGPVMTAGVLCLPVVLGLALPGTSAAATSGPATLQATIAGDGAVQSTKEVASNGSTSPYNGQLPLTLSITRSVSGAASTYTYTVTNTDTRQQTVHYTDTAGKKHSATVQLQLPLVAMLGVVAPKGMEVSAPTNATSITGPDGSHHLIWQLVMFSPLGSATQTVSFSAIGKGNPVAELQARAIDPTATQGLSQSGQDATANVTQDDFWSSYISGGADGLNKLASGTTQLVSGLEQLAAGATTLSAGLKTAGSGANQLDTGTKSAKNGADSLSSGIGTIHTGQGALTSGLKTIHSGQGSLTGGLSTIHSGQGSLTDGLKTLTAGQGSLTDGLAQLDAGLGQLGSPTGLGAAITGVQQLDTGVGSVLTGIGPNGPATPGLLDAAELVRGGVETVKTNTTALATGLQCAYETIEFAATAHAAGAALPCGGTFPYPLPGLDGASAALLIGVRDGDPTHEGVALQLEDTYNVVHASIGSTPADAGTLTQLIYGAQQEICGLSLTQATTDGFGATCPAGEALTGGVKEGLGAIKAGLDALLSPTTGLPSASTGVAALTAGADQALAGSKQLGDGSASALAGSEKLYAGSGVALAGAKQLTEGSGSALAGARKLYAGSGTAYAGSKSLAAGLAKLSSGQHQVATGLPAAVTGSGQIASNLYKVLDGVKSVNSGIGQVKSGATSPLATQLAAGSRNAHQQVAVLQAAGALAAQAPGGAGTSYVLTQNPKSFQLASDSTPLSSGGSSHTGRNVGLGIGAAILLVLALIGGFAAGRRGRGTAHVAS